MNGSDCGFWEWFYVWLWALLVGYATDCCMWPFFTWSANTGSLSLCLLLSLSLAIWFIFVCTEAGDRFLHWTMTFWLHPNVNLPFAIYFFDSTVGLLYPHFYLLDSCPCPLFPVKNRNSLSLKLTLLNILKFFLCCL